jgi:glycosyltransferase involved in cell wall biosynthesis
VATGYQRAFSRGQGGYARRWQLSAPPHSDAYSLKQLSIIALFEGADSASGGGSISDRNRRFLARLADEGGVSLSCIYEQGAPQLLDRVWRVFMRLSLRTYLELFRALQRGGVSLVWLDRSTMGFASLIVRLFSDARVVVFYHNHEGSYHLERARCLPLSLTALRFRWEALAATCSQWIISATAHRFVFISPVEMARLATSSRLRTRACVCPPSWVPLEQQVQTNPRMVDEPKLLMVGSDFEPNLLGFRWFIEAVLPHLDVSCLVVGRNLERRLASTHKARVHGYMLDLQRAYAASQVCVVPVFRGAGLKVKLAEALFHGKRVVASTHAAAPFHDLLPAEVRRDLIFEFNDAAGARAAVVRALEGMPAVVSLNSARNVFTDDVQYSTLRAALNA